MAFLLKKSWTAPLPRGAEIVMIDGVRMARWRLRNGQPRTAEVLDGADGRPRIRGQTKAFTLRYCDPNGVWRERPTKCRDERAARNVLNDLEKRVERVRAGLLTECEE